MSPADTIERPYSEADVERLRGSVTIEHTLARLGAERLRRNCSPRTSGCRRSER